MTIRKRYELEGLCCANCAAEIEREVGGLEGVSAASVDFASRLLTVELAEPAAEHFAEQAENIAKRHDSDIALREKELAQPGKKVMYLVGLNCADCAKKIETAVRGMDGVQSANLDFVSQKLTIEASDQQSLPVLARQAAQIVHEIEPDVEISYTGKAAAESPEGGKKQRLRQIGLAAGAVLFLLGMVLKLPQPAEFTLFLISYLLVGGEVVLRALKNIAKGRVFDENFLMSIATVGAFAIGDFAEGVAVMLFYQIGEFFQDLAVNRSRRSISALMDIRPDYANLKIGGEIKKVSPEEVGVGDLILVRPGEKVPLDGKVTEGSSSVDTAALTGESLPRDVEPGSELLSGSVNKNGVLTVEVTKEFGESTVTKILDLVQNAGSRKAPTENFITKFAGYYTPAVVFSALALAVIPPLMVPGASFPVWINRALTFLVVSCPCALVISIPLSFFGGIGCASKNGILIKGSNYLEALNHVDTVVFDKTGTLTKGNFTVTQINPAEGWTRDEILRYAAHSEFYSGHPIAASIREAYGKEPEAARIAGYEEISGKGVRVTVNGRNVLAGNGKLMDEEKISWQASSEAGTVVYLAVDGTFAGSIVISDEIKPDSAGVIQSLKAAGVRHTAMLTGDSRATGEKVAKELGLDSVYAELLPQQKVEQMEALSKQTEKGDKLVFVGDGINDAPVLARADVGVAMGGLGSDAAIEAADVVLMTDEPSKLADAIRIAKRTRSIVRQNIIFALGVKIAILILAAFGIATMWAAVFGDVGVTVIAVLNAIRATNPSSGKSR
ncbi:MAG TPA: heavy metal translocating P-type ATPase [Caproiciproducens sp.]|nr:heavy metal translocating P-type ATPase [Caproiciproducens sp.]